MKPVSVERWRAAVGMPDIYEVSNLGRLRCKEYTDKRGWLRKSRILKTPNAEFSTRIEGKRLYFSIAAVILRTFVGPPPKGCYLARHLNDNREDNALGNLAWGDDQDNRDDAVRNGRSFVSYGRLGKPCSEETKLKLKVALKGRKTGRRIDAKHRLALETGYANWRAGQ